MAASYKIKQILQVLSGSPGVYQFMDASDKIIYVGKAKNLKNRVSSYFSGSHVSGKTAILIKQIADIRTIKVDTEMDALLLENSLIKKYQPKYNIQLKDDKTYPWICIKNEPFPRVIYTREVQKDGGEYYGPFSSVRMIKTLLELFVTSCGIRNCNHNLTLDSQGKFETAVEYYLGNCKGCCQGKVSKKEYDHRLRDVKKILKGSTASVIEQLRNKMKKAAADLKFEIAHDYKERIALIEKYQSRSMVVSASLHNIDVYGFDDDLKSAYVHFLKVMNGAIIQSYTLEIKKGIDDDKLALLEMAILEIRRRFPSRAREIILPFDINLPPEGVNIFVPLKGEKKSLLDLCVRNAEYYKLEKRKQKALTNPEAHVNRILTTLQKDLRLSELPFHIECFDNSNFQGTNAVAACVVFKNAKPSKKDYRHFNIKTVEGPDDFASMEEIVLRRYARMIEEGHSLPQLIIIDGGKGQLSAAVKSLRELSIYGKVAVIGIAKKLEEIYFPGDSLPIYLDKRSESLKLIQYARNEAHRFGITHHRSKRSKAAVSSELDVIPGIGEKTQLVLYKRFKTLSGIKSATLIQLQETLGKSKGKIIFDYFAAKTI